MEPLLNGTIVHGTLTELYDGAWSLSPLRRRCMEPLLNGTMVHGTFLTEWYDGVWNLN